MQISTGTGDMILGAARLLADMSAELAALARVRAAQGRRMSPNFSAVALLKPNENGLSRLIGTLLDPRGVHEHGSLFLEHFIRTFVREEHPLRRIDCSNNLTTVMTEAPTRSIPSRTRRIDILVSCGGNGLGIENKPWADDQHGQVADYLDDLSRRFSVGHCLVYLAGAGTPPSEASISIDARDVAVAEGRLVVVSYREFATWLTSCRSLCESERLRAFVDDFATYLRREFVGTIDPEEQRLVAGLIRRDDSTLAAALAIVDAFDEIKDALWEKVVAQIGEDVQARGGAVVHWKRKPGSDPYNSCSVQPDCSQSRRVTLSFEARGYRQLIVGFTLNDAPTGLSPEAVSALNERFESGCSSKYWPWYAPVEFARDWTDVRIWRGVAGGEMGPKLVKLIYEVFALAAAPAHG